MPISNDLPASQLPDTVRARLLQVQSLLIRLELDQAAELLQQTQGLAVTPGDVLLAQTLNFASRLQADASLGDASLLQQVYALCERAASAPDDPLPEAIALTTLGALQSRMRLHHAALSNLERAQQLSQSAHSRELSEEIQTTLGRVLAQAGMFEDLLRYSEQMLGRRKQLPAGVVHRVLNHAATACFVLADEQLAPPEDPLWQRCRAFHHDALATAEQAGLNVDAMLSELNLSYIEVLIGSAADCRLHLERLNHPAAEAMWRQIAGGPYAVRLSQLLLSWRESPEAEHWQTLLEFEREAAELNEKLRFVHEYTLRAIVRFGQIAGDAASALRCSQQLLSLQRRRVTEVTASLSRSVEDIFQLQKARLENEQLTRHGSQLELSLAARNAELQQTLSRLQAEASIRRAAEAALQQANEELEARVLARTASLEDALRTVMQQEKQLALGRMVVGMAHELNTPLGNARMGASVIRDRAQELEQWLQSGPLRRQALSETASSLQQCSSLVDRSLESASQLIQRLKALSRDSEQEMAQDFEVCALLRQILDSYRPRCANAGIQLRLDLPTALTLFGPMQSLSNVVQELLDNALDHGLKQQHKGEIALQLSQDGKRLRLSIEDNGCGIPTEDLPRIFDPFFSARLGAEGAGLGLSVVRSVVEGLMQGHISIESTAGRGTRVVLNLPLQ